MKSVSCFRDLEQFGIRPLTGEADALGFRILCDLTEEGVKVFKECFGMPGSGNCGLASNWNSGAIASVMLSKDSIRPLAVMGFYLQGCDVVITDTGVYALEDDDQLSLESLDTGYLYNGRMWPNCYGKIRRIIRQRKSDGTLSLAGVRYEIPARYRHLERVSVHFASWDLSAVDLVDTRTGEIVCPLYPLDKQRNADGRRKTIDDGVESPPPAGGMAPLLRELLAEYAASGLPPAYIPKTNRKEED